MSEVADDKELSRRFKSYISKSKGNSSAMADAFGQLAVYFKGIGYSNTFKEILKAMKMKFTTEGTLKVLKAIKEGGPGSGRPTKAGSKRDVEKRMDKAVSDANAKLDAAEKAAKKKKKNEGKLTEKKKTIPFKDIPSYMKDHYPTQKHWDYYQSLPDGKKWMYYKKYPDILAKQSKKTDDFIAQQKKELGLEGKLTEGWKKIAKKNVKYKDKWGNWNWEIESGIDTDALGGNIPKIILHYQLVDEEDFPSSGGNTFWLKHKNGKPFTPQEAKALVNKISNKKIHDFQRKSTNPSGSGQNIYYVDGKFIREGKLKEGRVRIARAIDADFRGNIVQIISSGGSIGLSKKSFRALLGLIRTNMGRTYESIIKEGKRFKLPDGIVVELDMFKGVTIYGYKDSKVVLNRKDLAQFLRAAKKNFRIV